MGLNALELLRAVSRLNICPITLTIEVLELSSVPYTLFSLSWNMSRPGPWKGADLYRLTCWKPPETLKLLDISQGTVALIDLVKATFLKFWQHNCPDVIYGINLKWRIPNVDSKSCYTRSMPLYCPFLFRNYGLFIFTDYSDVESSPMTPGKSFHSTSRKLSDVRKYFWCAVSEQWLCFHGSNSLSCQPSALK